MGEKTVFTFFEIFRETNLKKLVRNPLSLMMWIRTMVINFKIYPKDGLRIAMLKSNSGKDSKL